MSERMIPVKLLDDITECPVCTENFNDPRSLPCLHTFCLACVSKWSGDKHSGDHVACPLCRKEFTIPQKGLEELPKNIFIGKLLAVKDIPHSASSTQLCDWCVADSKISDEDKKKAKQFCVECDENLCEDCVDTHSRLKRCRSHQTHNIGEKVPTALLPTRCDKHPKEDLKLFCLECKEALCILCFATKHTGHESAEIDEVADEFKREIAGNISHLGGGADSLAALLSTLQTKRKKIVDQSDEVEAQITSAADQMKLTVERLMRKLITELTNWKTEQLKEVDTMTNDVAQNKALIESLMKYSRELVNKGSHGDIAREIKLMKLRVAELKKFYDIEPDTIRNTTVLFVPSDNLLDKFSIGLGRLEITTDENLCPTLCFTIPSNGNGINAVTSFNNELFVARTGTKKIEVYDSSTFNRQRFIELPVDAGDHCEGLAVCSVNDCLYVSDWDNDKVYSINLSESDNGTITKWSVADGPAGLSVNQAHNLLVACFGLRKVQKYTPVGNLVRERELVHGVRHAVELNDGTLVVSQADNSVSVLSLDGIVLRRYPPSEPPVRSSSPSDSAECSSSSGSESSASSDTDDEDKQMDDPRSLAVDKNGFILVADEDNDRILVLNPELTDARSLPLTLDPPLTGPRGVWFEESRGRLYVGEYGGEERVLAFDNVFNIHTLFE